MENKESKLVELLIKKTSKDSLNWEVLISKTDMKMFYFMGITVTFEWRDISSPKEMKRGVSTYERIFEISYDYKTFEVDSARVENLWYAISESIDRTRENMRNKVIDAKIAEIRRIK